MLTRLPRRLNLNQWALGGSWNVDPEKAVLDAAPGKIVFRFYARDLHLVLGPGSDGKPVRFRVTVGRRGAGGQSWRGYGFRAVPGSLIRDNACIN